MKMEFTNAFNTVRYPCFLLNSAYKTIWVNDAAKRLCPPLCKIHALRTVFERTPALFINIKNGEHETVSFADSPPFGNGALSVTPLEEGAFCSLEIGTTPLLPPAQLFSAALREPLTSVFSFLPLLARRLDQDSATLAYVEEMNRNCYRLLRAIDNMGLLMKAETARDVALSPYNLAQLGEAICTAAASICAKEGVPIHCIIKDTILPCAINEYLFCTALTNLLLNALIYTRDGNEITVTLSGTAHNVLILVSDKGMGIKPEVVQQIYTNYFSIDPYNDGAVVNKLGLGIPVAKAAIELFGGTLAVNSTFGEGTTVAISLPLAQEESETLFSSPASYLLNRFSPLYIQLSDLCQLPDVF